MKTDKQGRAYARLSDLRFGQQVWLDGGFTCRPPGPARLIEAGGELCFACRQLYHGLEAQTDADGYCIGVYPEDPGAMEWEQKECS